MLEKRNKFLVVSQEKAFMFEQVINVCQMEGTMTSGMRETVTMII